MTAHFSAPGGAPNPGGATVASLRALDDVQVLAVMLMRDGFDGPQGLARVHDAFVEILGKDAGPAAAEHWTGFARFLLAHARRPLMRHALTCPCVGADEAVVAQLLHLAATGAREDAILILTLLVPADRALCAVTLAENAGLAVMRAARTAAWRPAPTIPRLH